MGEKPGLYENFAISNEKSIAVLNKMRYTPLATDALWPMPYARESTSCY
jgi:hypothetical protein